jgi:hypothetical protein
MAPLKNITIQENLGFESLNCIIFTEITQTYNSERGTINKERRRTLWFKITEDEAYNTYRDIGEIL